MSLNDAVEFGTKYTKKRDVLFVLENVAGFTAGDVLIRGETEFPKRLFGEYESKLKRLHIGEPLQYVLGKWEFCGTEYITDKRALIPRPETELLAEMVIDYVKNKEKLHILDVCTGSGCIGLSIAKLTSHNVVLADISIDALDLARQNHQAMGAPPNVQITASDLLESVHGEFDVIVSNPPYIESRDMETLPKNVKNYEPLLALDGGPGGLEVYKKLIPQCFHKLKTGGKLFLEIGPGKTASYMEKAGFTNISVYKDYAGLNRILRGEKNV